MIYSEKEIEEIKKAHEALGNIKTIVKSDWWPNFKAALIEEMIGLIDDLDTMIWSHENLSRFAGKLYGMRLLIRGPEEFLYDEANLNKIIQEIEE